MVKIWEPQGAHEATGPLLVRYHYRVILAAVAVGAFIAFGPGAENLTMEAQRTLGVFALIAWLYWPLIGLR